MQNSGSPQWRKTLFLIFIGALVVRGIFIFCLQDGFYFGDGKDYAQAASHLAAHGEFPADFDRSPLYPLFLTVIYKVAGEAFIYTRIVQAIMGALIAILIAMIGRRLGGVAVGIVAGVLWSIYPMGAFISGIVYPTTLLTILLAGGVLCLVTNPYDNKYPARVCLAGLLFGLSAMAKPIVLGTIICVAFWFALRRSSDRVLLVSIFLLTTLMALMPWSVRNAFVHDRLVPIESRGLAELVPWAEAPETVANNKTKAVATVKHGFATPPSKPMVNEQPEVLAQPNKNQVWGQFTRMAKRFPREFMSFFEVYPRRVGYLKQGERDRALKDNPQLVRYTIFGSDLVMAVSFLSVVPLFITALIGMCVMYKNRDNRHKLVLLGLMIMSFALGYATSWGKIRYRIPVDPYIIILSAWGVVYLWNTVVKKPALHIE